MPLKVEENWDGDGQESEKSKLNDRVDRVYALPYGILVDNVKADERAD